MAFSTPNPRGKITNKVYLLRQNGALVGVFSTENKALVYMKTHRKNSEFWRIEAKEVL